MDRTYWIQVGQFLPGEKVILQQKVVRLYDGEESVSFVNVNRVWPFQLLHLADIVRQWNSTIDSTATYLG